MIILPEVKKQIIDALQELYGDGRVLISSAYYYHTARRWDIFQ